MNLEGSQTNSFEGSEWVLPIDTKVIEKAEEALFKKVEKAGWSSDEVLDFVETSFHEGLINAFGHGTLGISGRTEGIMDVIKAKLEELKKNDPEKILDRKVRVNIIANREKITVSITDEGEGFDVSEVPDFTALENLLQPSGRGIGFMKLHADVSYEDGGRKVILVKERAKT